MIPTPKQVFASLRTGDLLVIPLDHVPGDRISKAFAAVLGVEEDGVNLSIFSPDEILPIPYSKLNPFRWDDEAEALVGRDGKVPVWYSPGIRAEPGVAIAVAEAYAAIPRMEQLRMRASKADLLDFVLDPRFVTISCIVKNGDVTLAADQVSLILDVLGVECSHDQLVGICWAFELIGQQLIRNPGDLMEKLAAVTVANDPGTFLGSVSTTRQ